MLQDFINLGIIKRLTLHNYSDLKGPLNSSASRLKNNNACPSDWAF